MLTLQKCRSLLGPDCKLTDAELEQLRHELYVVAEVAISDFCVSRPPSSSDASKSLEKPTCLSTIPEAERHAVEERAAILEFEANLKKPEAERQAFGEWAQSKKPPKRKARKKAIRRRR